MDPQQQNVSNPNQNMGAQMPPAPSSGSSMGVLIGGVVLLAILILGGFYFWGQKMEKEEMDAENAQTEQTVQSIQTQGSSDDVNSIETDLNTTDVEGVDAEINAS